MQAEWRRLGQMDRTHRRYLRDDVGSWLVVKFLSEAQRSVPLGSRRSLGQGRAFPLETDFG